MVEAAKSKSSECGYAAFLSRDFFDLVILPARILTGLQPEVSQAILAHELAHFARRDGWVHLAQIALETLFFYYPAGWWLGRSAD